MPHPNTPVATWRTHFIILALTVGATACPLAGELALDGTTPKAKEPGQFEAIFGAVEGVLSILGVGLDIADAITDPTQDKLDYIIGALVDVNGKLDAINGNLVLLSEQIRTMSDTMRFKFDEVLTQTRQSQLTNAQAQFEEAYSQIQGKYKELQGCDAATLERMRHNGELKSAVQTICAKWSIASPSLEEHLRLYTTVMTGTDGVTSALDALTNKLLTQMTLETETSRITVSTAVACLTSYFVERLTVQGKGSFCVKEIIFAQDKSTQDKQAEWATYQSGTLHENMKRQVALYRHCVTRLVSVNMDLTTQSDRNDIPLCKELKNSAGTVIFSQTIAEDAFRLADLLACAVLPDTYPSGLYARIVGEPTRFPSTDFTVSADGLGDMAKSGADQMCPTTSYLAWTVDSGTSFSFTMHNKLQESVYHIAASAGGEWDCKARDAGATAAEGRATLAWYDTSTGSLATDHTKTESKLLFGSALMTLARKQPQVKWSKPEAWRTAEGGDAASDSVKYSSSLVDEMYTNYKTSYFYVRGDTSTYFNKCRPTYASKTSTQNMRYTGNDCQLTLKQMVGFYPSYGSAGTFDPFSGSTAEGYLGWLDMTTASPSRRGPVDLYATSGGIFPVTRTTCVRNDANLAVYSDIIVHIDYGSFFSPISYLRVIFGAYKPEPVDHSGAWAFPLELSVAGLPSNAFSGRASQAFGAYSADTSTGKGHKGAETLKTFFTVAFDPLKMTATLSEEANDLPSTWKLVGSGDFAPGEYGSRMLFFDSESRAFSFLSFLPHASTNRSDDDTTTAQINNIAGLTLAEGVEFMATGDFNGDGKTDLLVGDSSTGEYYVDILRYGALAESATLAFDPALGAPIFHIADFNADGNDDILAYFEAGGACQLVLMNGSNIVENTKILDSVSGDWMLLAAADFDADGKAELLWRAGSKDELAMLFCDGVTIEGFKPVKIDGSPNRKGWSLAQVGDFNADGKHDLLWRKAGRKGIDLFVSYMDGVRSLDKKLGRSGIVKLRLPQSSIFF